MSPRPLLALAFALGALGGCFLSANVPPSFRFNCKADADCRVLTCRGDLVAIPEAEAAGLEPTENCATIADDEQNLYYQARQTCMNGLCEYPCDISNGSGDCPSGKGYNFCFNGACATACGYDPERFPDPDATCSDPQDCIIFGEDIDLALIAGFLPTGGSGSSSSASFIPSGGGGGTSVEDLEGTGICGTRCDADGALACPPGQYCSGAMCLPDCDHPDATPCAEGRTCFAFGDYSACLVTCAAASDCEPGETCVTGLNICRPTCVGDGASSCGDGMVCDPTLEICVPETTGTSG